jgi:hypothetical protein
MELQEALQILEILKISVYAVPAILILTGIAKIIWR